MFKKTFKTLVWIIFIYLILGCQDYSFSQQNPPNQPTFVDPTTFRNHTDTFDTPRGNTTHRALDIVGPTPGAHEIDRAPVVSVATGTVTGTGNDREGGRFIIINHGNGWES